MLGEIQAEDGHVIARLLRDLTWMADKISVVDFLARELPPSSYSPSDGIPGRMMLTIAAELLGGKVVWLDPTPAPVPGRIY